MLLNHKKLPKIDVGDLCIPRVAEQVWEAIISANNPPFLFRNCGRIVRIERGEDGALKLVEMTEDRMRYLLARVVRWVKKSLDQETGEIIEKDALPPKHVCKDVLATPEPPLPVLEKIVHIPIFSQNGDLWISPGYHTDMKIFYDPIAGFSLPAISERPNVVEIEKAKCLILDDLFGDFPFVGPSEKAHAVAFLLLPFIRKMIVGPTPLHLVEAPSPGTGKTLLADILSLITTGKPALAMTEARSEEEWRKRITAKLRNGTAILFIDNLRNRLDSSAVAAAITAPTWEDRILGKSETIRIPIQCGWLATGNNPSLSGEIARRTVRIRLDAKVDRPWLRRKEFFRISNLVGWVAKNREELVVACLTLIQAWIAEGQCAASSDQPILGMFEGWSSVFGGIFKFVGIPSFLGNLQEFYEVSDAEGEMWRSLISAWFQKFRHKPVGVSDLWLLSSQIDGFSNSKGSERSKRTQFGKMLSQARDRQFQIENGKMVCLRPAGTHQHAKLWKLVDASVMVDEGPIICSPVESSGLSQEGKVVNLVNIFRGGGNEDMEC